MKIEGDVSVALRLNAQGIGTMEVAGLDIGPKVTGVAVHIEPGIMPAIVFEVTDLPFELVAEKAMVTIK